MQVQIPKEILLLELSNLNLFQKAITFKQYHQEYTGRNKDNPLKFGSNENLIELGNDLIDFYYYEFFSFQDLPKKEHKRFNSYSEIRRLKQIVLAEKNLAELAVKIGLKEKMLVSTNPNSEIKNNTKVQSQALKAIVGAQYFDKKKDLNLLRNIMMILYQDLIKISIDEQMSIPKQENFKGEFQEYMNKHPEFYFKLNYQEIKSKFDQNQTIYEYELVINDVIPIKRSGEQKKTVERLVFKDAVSLLKTDSFQQLLDDSMRSQLDQSIVLEKSFQFQEKGFEQEQQHNGSQVSSNIHQLLIKNVDKLENLKSKIEFLQKNTEDEKAEISQVIEQFLMHY